MGSKDDLGNFNDQNNFVQGSVDSVGNELVIDINTNEYKLGHNVRTMAKRFFIGLMLLITTLVFALPEDRGEPIEIVADNAVINEKQNQAKYSGAVAVTIDV